MPARCRPSEILGTILLSVLSGHRRYAQITGMRGDDMQPQLLGIGKFRSEDSVRRTFEKQNEEALTLWMDRQMNETYAALLDQQWVLDLDSTVKTVKTLYGWQEEARFGYNPMKPGRPSHVCHSLVLAAAKLVFSVDAEAGNDIASAYGNEEMMAGFEQRGLAQCRAGLGRRRELQGWTRARRGIVLRRKLEGRLRPSRIRRSHRCPG